MATCACRSVKSKPPNSCSAPSFLQTAVVAVQEPLTDDCVNYANVRAVLSDWAFARRPTRACSIVLNTFPAGKICLALWQMDGLRR